MALPSKWGRAKGQIFRRLARALSTCFRGKSDPVPWTPLDYDDGSPGGRTCATSDGSLRLLAVNRRRPAEAGELPERWSVQRKGGAGTAAPSRRSARCRVSREPGPRTRARELEAYVPGERSARVKKTRSDPEERELTLARAKFGELMMRLELSEHLIEKGGSRTSRRSCGDETRRSQYR